MGQNWRSLRRIRSGNREGEEEEEEEEGHHVAGAGTRERAQAASPSSSCPTSGVACQMAAFIMRVRETLTFNNRICREWYTILHCTAIVSSGLNKTFFLWRLCARCGEEWPARLHFSPFSRLRKTPNYFSRDPISGDKKGEGGEGDEGRKGSKDVEE